MHTYMNVPSNSANTTVTGSPNLISADDAKAIVAEASPPGPPKPIDPEGDRCLVNFVCSNHIILVAIVDKWYYVKAD